MAGDETSNSDGGKSDGDDDKVGGQATASIGEGGRRGEGGKGDGDGDGDGVGDGNGDEAGRRRRGQG